MQIVCLDPLGINGYERKANDVLEEHLPNNWKGYSSLEMIGRQSNEFEADIILITDDRIIVVELKNYTGKLYSDNRGWVQEYSDGHQETRRDGVKQARRAAQILSSKLDQKLKGKFRPWVDFCVVLCGSADNSNLPSDEREYVFTLDEFKKIGDVNHYVKCFGKKKSFKRKEDFPNKNITIWDRIFSNNSADFKAKTFSVNNYIQKSTALFQHKDHLYAEFQSERANNHNYKALMRRWDFTAPCIVESARTPEQRALIAHRESSVLGYIDTQEDDLKDLHLSLLHLPTDLSSDFVELYEWPSRKERLEQFIRKNKSKLSDDSRLDLIQALISQLARLHDIDVAHRDIGSHSIWLSLPSKVVLSNFLTASYPDPQNKTVSNVRSILQHGRVVTPEDLFDDSDGTAFTRDVYLATAASHYIAFGCWPNKQDGIYSWSPIKNNKLSELLQTWFDKGLELESGQRFQDLRESLTEFNRLLKGDKPSNNGALESISPFLSTKNIYADFGAIPEQVNGTCHLLKTPDEKLGVKAWFGVSDTNKGGGINHQLLAFLHRVQIISTANLSCIQEISEFGFNAQMQNVYFVFEWANGITWDTFLTDAEKGMGTIIGKSLLKSLLKLHSAHLFHGDIQPGNIIINDSEVTFIDIVEYNHTSESRYTPSYVPDNFENISINAIDRFATIKLVNELANKFGLIHLINHTKLLMEQPEISVADVEKLHDEYDAILNPPPPKEIEKFEINHKNFSSITSNFVSDDGVFYVLIKLNAGKNKDLVRIILSGTKNQVDLLVNPENKFVVTAYIKEIRHDQFMWNKRDSDIEIKGDISLANSSYDNNIKLLNAVLESPVFHELTKRSENVPLIKNETSRSILTLAKPDKPKIGSASEIWKVLVETEHESNPKIQVTTEPKRTETGRFTFNYTSENNKLDFDLSKENVALKTELRGELREIGRIEDFGSDTILYRPKGRNTPRVGDSIVLEGSLSAASLAKREKAVSNLVMGRGVISNITDYFSPGLSIEPTVSKMEPSDEELEEYTEYGADKEILFELNELQRKAFKDIYRYGPVTLLQGPPGTGKTAFIGSFIHYTISKGAKRVLLVSQSHEAVNNAAEKVRSLFGKVDKSIDIVRLGDQRNLSMNLDDVGEKSLQEHYRDKFRAEYKERICALVDNLGLEHEFVEIVTDYELSFGQKIDRLISQSKDSELLENMEFNQRVNKIKDQLSSFINRTIDIQMDFEGVALCDIRDKLYGKLSLNFEVYSPELIDKLKNIIFISNEWLSVMASSKAQFQNFLAKTRTLVCGTCVGIGRYQYGIQENIYDLVVIDEAARSPASELAIAMQVGRKILLVGDHKQLPPLFDDEHIKAAKRILPSISSDEFKRSDFERAFLSDYGQVVGQSLMMQYRMAPTIGDLVSHCFYDNALETGRGEPEPEYADLPASLGKTVTWLDTSSKGKNAEESRPNWKGANTHSAINSGEADVVISLLSQLMKADNNSQIFKESEEPTIGIICMYGEQSRLLIKKINTLAWARTLLEKRIIKVDTVDSYQGKENSIVIVSLVRSNKHFSQGHVSSENRANVALSRAKERLYVVGDNRMWSRQNQESAFGRVYSYITSEDNDDCCVIDAVSVEKL
ncbi:AAA family ATPase [Colwellia demingiae]|uniref:AAA family ATPase n=1 Tax=Colwellia demingiae TaxID=89401 RepID=A0A5C6QSS1_9GAMM|nr:AAA domain-containing protein [Colwellia demingiae]TWX71723.1 AAA family ATPase [Colwellia demingiae]